MTRQEHLRKAQMLLVSAINHLNQVIIAAEDTEDGADNVIDIAASIYKQIAELKYEQYR